MKTTPPVIALVDDDKIFQLTTAKIIRSLSPTNSILQFENGEDALKHLRDNAHTPENLPDYIFLDINMPYVDGWMFLADYATLKATLQKDIAIIMISSSIDPRDIKRAKNNSDVRDYVSKPVTPDLVRSLLQAATV
jgi:two-component system, chemotaxis family, chemotaxis protein CheY